MKKFTLKFSERIIQAKRDLGNDMPFTKDCDQNVGDIIAESITEPNGTAAFAIKDGVTAKPYFGPKATYFEYFNDMMDSRDYNTTDWTVTTVEAGAGDATEALGDVSGGVLVLTNDAADDDCDQIQFNQEAWLLANSKKLWFETRVKISDATDADFSVGLIAAEDLTAVADNLPADGAVFHKLDTSTNLNFSSSKNGTNETLSAIATVADDTYLRLGFYFDGTYINTYVDGVYTGRIETTICDDEQIAPFFMVRNGEAVAKVLTIDYIHVIQER